MRSFALTLIFAGGVMLGFSVASSWLAVLCIVTLFAVFTSALIVPAERSRRAELDAARRRRVARMRAVDSLLTGGDY